MPMPHKQTEPVALVLALAGTVHAGRHSSTLKALRITMVGPYSQALLTLYGPPDCRRRYTEGPGDLVRIALYLYDPHLNNLKGENCGPVSQTRVCEPPNKGESPTRTAPGLTRGWSEDRPAQVSPTGLAGRIQPLSRVNFTSDDSTRDYTSRASTENYDPMNPPLWRPSPLALFGRPKK